MADTDTSLPLAWGGDNVDGVKKKTSRRNFLIGATTVAGATGVGFAAVPFVKSWLPSERAKAVGGPVKVDISRLKPGELLIKPWRGQPVFVIRLTEAMQEIVAEDDAESLERLADPDSDKSTQPEYTKTPTRSVRQDIQVLIGLCTHLGCSPKFVPDAVPQDFDASWMGGFFCPCHGSKFDLAGKVYKGVPAPTNMSVPPHRYVDDHTIIVGEDPVS